MLDTHVALWVFAAPETLHASLRRALEDPRNSVAVSSVSVWEVEIKRALGKLTAPAGFGTTCIERGFDALPINFEHAELAAGLPQHHGDPFDRMLIAQAIVEDFELVSNDEVFEQYDVRLVRATR